MTMNCHQKKYRWFSSLRPAVVACLVSMVLTMGGCASFMNTPHHAGIISIGPFNSEDADTQQERIQQALSAAGSGPATVVFAPGEYYIVHPEGIRVPSDVTLIMTGARFVASPSLRADGQVFLIRDGENITFQGGTVIGHRSAWPDDVNVAGIRVYGNSRAIHINGTTFLDLSSNAVGIFARDERHPIQDVVLTRVKARNCCNEYGDYLSERPGPAPGSRREDQGTVAMYYVDGWRVEGCRFEASHSDGTHFYRSRNGIFSNSVVSDSRMGGYFLEGCEHVVASNNLFLRNGSRGVTIERDSAFCILQNTVTAFSGREGLWAPDVQGIVVSHNIFRLNGRKDDGERDCEIRFDDTEHFATQTGNIRIEGNLFVTDAHQTAAVFMGSGLEPEARKTIAVKNNTFTGDAPELYRAPENIKSMKQKS